MVEERRKRNPAVEKRISEVFKEDIRVAVIGTVVEKDPSIHSILIDDGDKSIRIILPEELYDTCEIGKVIRAIGIVAPALDGDEVELRGEIVQDFSKLDKNLYIAYLNNKSV